MGGREGGLDRLLGSRRTRSRAADFEVVWSCVRRSRREARPDVREDASGRLPGVDSRSRRVAPDRLPVARRRHHLVRIQGDRVELLDGPPRGVKLGRFVVTGSQHRGSEEPIGASSTKVGDSHAHVDAEPLDRRSSDASRGWVLTLSHGQRRPSESRVRSRSGRRAPLEVVIAVLRVLRPERRASTATGTSPTRPASPIRPAVATPARTSPLTSGRPAASPPAARRCRAPARATGRPRRPSASRRAASRRRRRGARSRPAPAAGDHRHRPSRGSPSAPPRGAPVSRRQDRGTRRALVDELEAEAALDAEVALGHRRVERRGHLDDPLVLDVQVDRAAHAAVRADRVGHGLGVSDPTCRPRACRTRSWPSARRSGTRRCSCRSTRTPTRAAARPPRSRCARRSRVRRPRSRTCSGRPRRTPRRTCSRGCTSSSRGRRGRCRPWSAGRRWRRTRPRPRSARGGVRPRARRARRPAAGGAGRPNRVGSAPYRSM